MATVTRRPPCKCKDKSRCGHKPWVARVWADGRQQQASFKTKGEASGYALRAEQSKRDGAFTDPRGDAELFGDAARKMIAGKRTANTREAYTTVLSVHLQDFTGRRLRDVANDYEGVKAAVINHPQGKRMLSVIRNTCQEAISAGRLPGHRLHDIHPNVVPGRRELIPHTPQQVDQIARAMGDEGLAVYLMYGTGMRIGEVLALRSADFISHFEGYMMVHVWQQGTEEKTLKSKRNFDGRNIPVAPSLYAKVREHVAAHGEGDLFRVNREQTFRTHFKKAARMAGLPDDFIPHMLRHGYATRRLAEGRTLSNVAEWLGDDPKTVAATYAHVVPEQEQKAIGAVEAEFAQMAA